MSSKFILGCVIAGCIGAAAQASPNLVSNGDFESSSYKTNNEFGAGFGGQGVTDWTGLGGNHLQFYYFGGTQATTNATNQYGDPLGYFRPNFSTLSPNGGNFVALDGDSDYSGSISQLVGGLTVGKKYVLSFSWAASQFRNRTGPTTEQFTGTFGSDPFATQVVNNPSEGFTGWMTNTFSFTAANTSQLLTFLSVGTPNGLPPVAALDGVSITAVPEPATWGLMLAGFGLVGFAARRRRTSVVA